MDQRSVRVVVGHGDPGRGAALRTVLEGDGFDIVGEVTSTADLARLLLVDQPDVVVLDDAIGVTAVQVVGELAPAAKLVVVWPAGVVPIGGAARVDPGEIQTALSATVGIAAGVELIGLGAIERPDWVDKVRKDPSTLREMLAASAAMPTRPSVTELQRRGKRLHPSTGMGKRSAARAAGAKRAAPVAAVPVAAAAAAATAGAGVGVGVGVGVAQRAPVVADGALEAARNRRLGMIALGGAAVAGALMIALSFGGHRSITVVVAGPFVPQITTPTIVPPAPGNNPTPTNGGPSGPSGGGTPPVTTDGGGTAPTGTLGGPGTKTPGTNSPGPTGGSGGGGTGGSGGTGSGTGGTPVPLVASPGSSAAHNPHGEPPGQARAAEASGAPHGAHGVHPVKPDHPTKVHPHKH